MDVAGQVVLLRGVCSGAAEDCVGAEAMTVQIVCDGCGSVIPFKHLRVVREGFITLSEPEEEHFCGWECLKEKAVEVCSGGSAS